MEFRTNDFGGARLRFGFRATAIGLALIAVSARGVAAILLGADETDLRRQLRSALPGALAEEDEAGLAATLDQVAAYVDRPQGTPPFPLDLRGSANELAVWAALGGIPAGETRSYGAVAKALGGALTAQEVGAACAANRVAVAVPCHRVVKADGSISGYRWGVPRKRKLINIEALA
jgi:AraC family transcriptional regulator, regulatory protein of adaptative response / methylated-DNA-[protein]-cysteine methyltransferase